MELSHFTIKELVPPEIYNKSCRDGIKLFDKNLLEVMEWIRVTIDKPITINDWAWGGKFKYRGYRPEACTVGAVNSPHKMGMAFDFDVQGITADEVRHWLYENREQLPHAIRCEEGVNWVHIDTRNKAGHKLYFFKP